MKSVNFDLDFGIDKVDIEKTFRRDSFHWKHMCGYERLNLLYQIQRHESDINQFLQYFLVIKELENRGYEVGCDDDDGNVFFVWTNAVTLGPDSLSVNGLARVVPTSDIIGVVSHILSLCNMFGRVAEAGWIWSKRGKSFIFENKDHRVTIPEGEIGDETPEYLARTLDESIASIN
jgi:hypothetical protein